MNSDVVLQFKIKIYFNFNFVQAANKFLHLFYPSYYGSKANFYKDIPVFKKLGKIINQTFVQIIKEYDENDILDIYSYYIIDP